MDSQDTELIKIATLQGRYGLESRQAVYDRINGLDIKPVARGKITPQQLELLDKLDKHIRGGGAIADFPIGFPPRYQQKGTRCKLLLRNVL